METGICSFLVHAGNCDFQVVFFFNAIGNGSIF